MKTILITGSTDGIGKLAAIKLAKAEHHVILHGRNGNKLESAISEIRALSNNESVTGYVSDLSNLENVRATISDLNSDLKKIDVLINNAGVFKTNVPLTKDGLDVRFVVNYFAPYVLTTGLLPLLQKSDSPRILNLSSAAQASVSLEALSGNETLTDQGAYAQSKLALTMWSFAFAKSNLDITTVAVNPGSLLNTKMVQEAYGRHWSPADKGANILYDLALSDEYENSNGKYFDNDNGVFNDAHEDAYDQEKIENLIAATEKIIAI